MNGGDSSEDPKVGVETLEWNVRLWEIAPEKRWVALIVALGAAALGWALFRTAALCMVGFVAIMGSTSEYWLPLRYKLDARGASVRCGVSVTAIEWTAVKRVAETEIGMRLSPLAKQTRTAQFRGVFLRYAGNRDQVLEYVNNLRGEGARLLEQGTDG
jgi:hypothetical protein